MGYIAHHAIVVTGHEDSGLLYALAKAKSLGMAVAGPCAEQTNGYRSFLVCPDGSKEGWDYSARGDRARADFVQWLRDSENSDGLYLDWAEIRFGGDDPHLAEVINHDGED